jgi:hypothetical protein
MLRAAEDRFGASVASLTVENDIDEDKMGFERGESSNCLQPVRNGKVADAVAVRTLVDPAMDHPGANYSFIVDDAIPEDVLVRLERTWEASTTEAAAAVETTLGEESDELAEKIRVSDGSSAVDTHGSSAARAKAIAEGTDARSMERLRADTCATRAHFCDVRGWARSAVLAAARESGMPARGVHPQFRILHYPNPGGVMAPHVDLSKVLDRVDSTWSADDRPVDAMKQMKPALQTTHTFLLYLRTCESGGETALLREVKNDVGAAGAETAHSLAEVKPVRGRLLVFPHDCPHAGRPVVDTNKLVLRGELW